MNRFSILSLLAACACACGDGGNGDGDLVVLAADGFELRFDLTRGAWDVVAEDGRTILDNAFCEVELGEPGAADPVVFRSTSAYVRTAEEKDSSDALGACERALIRMSGLEGAPDLTLDLRAYPAAPFFTAALAAESPDPQGMQVARMVPAKVDANRSGGLWLGTHPAQHRILEAGSFFIFDFFVDLVPGDIPEPAETALLGLIHGYQKGHSVSNWSHAIKDTVSGHAFVAGSLDFDLSSPMFNTSYDPGETRALDGRTPFTYWSAEFPMLPNGKPLPADGIVQVGPVFVLPDTPDPLGGLERYGDALHAWCDIALWNERGPDNRVPTGWNSWTGSGSSGGYGATIDEQLMIDNLDAMAAQFGDFGGEWFQIDDGYEYHYGDWDWREDRFPHGSTWLAEQIMERGLIPGQWIAVFQVSEDSQTYAQHAGDGWFAEQIPVLSGDMKILDLTHPEVLDWLTARFRSIRADGYRWVKTDFGYWALGAQSFQDPTVTREEAYRRGLAAIRKGLDLGAADAGGSPGDTFWLNVAMVGPHTGMCDSIRPNLDTMPAWDAESPDQGRKEAQGFKPTVRTMARRYYLHNRVYLFNHDMLFFRSHADASVPPITTDEARCLLTAMCLSGSVAKLGEKIVEMEPAWIDDYRKVIPVFGRAARPLDLFERAYPERWHLRVVPEQGLNTGGAGPAYDVVALFNWGTNRDLTTNPYGDMPDTVRSLSLELETVGLDPAAVYLAREFWSGETTEVQGVLEREVPPHTVQLFALRKRPDRPVYLGGNRHLLQGAVEIRGLAWDPGTSTLTVSYDAAPGTTKAPFTHRLDFWLPQGWQLAEANAQGTSAGTFQAHTNDRVVRVTFSMDTRQEIDVVLRFTRS